MAVTVPRVFLPRPAAPNQTGLPPLPMTPSGAPATPRTHPSAACLVSVCWGCLGLCPRPAGTSRAPHGEVGGGLEPRFSLYLAEPPLGLFAYFFCTTYIWENVQISSVQFTELWQMRHSCNPQPSCNVAHVHLPTQSPVLFSSPASCPGPSPTRAFCSCHQRQGRRNWLPSFCSQ